MKVTEVAAPLHTVWLATFTVGVGLTVMVNVIGVPGQVMPALVYCGVTVMLATIGALEEFVALNAGRLPDPTPLNPMLGSLLVQSNEMDPPVVGDTKFTAVVKPPSQTTWLATAFTVGVGLTMMLNVNGVPGQLTLS